ncbi:MAG: hypothetical protein ACJAYR_003631 [Sneathiella sp.]|jgi:hypothetical protein
MSGLNQQIQSEYKPVPHKAMAGFPSEHSRFRKGENKGEEVRIRRRISLLSVFQ